MKKTAAIFFSAFVMIILSGQILKAQSNKEEVDLFQSIFGMQKKAIVAEFLDVENNDPFWTLYDEYESKRKELGKKRLDLLVDYAQSYDSMNDEKYDRIITQMISLRKSTDKLMDVYYKKIKKSSGSKSAAQFFQLESYFASEIRAAIMGEIPYIGEFDKK